MIAVSLGCLGLGYMVGLNLGMVLVIAIVGSGVSGLLLAIPAVTPIVILFAGNPLLDGLSKAAVITVTIIAVNIAWLFAGATLTPLLKEERTSRIINICFAILLILSVLTTMLL